MKLRHLPNSVLPTKLFVVLNDDWLVTCEKQADSAAQALREAEAEHGPYKCRVAIPKTSYVPPRYA